MSVNQIPVSHPSFSVFVSAGQSSNGTAAQNATPAAGGGAAFVVTANVTPGVYSGGSSNVSGISSGTSVNPVANDQSAFGVTSAQTSFIVYAKSAWTIKTQPEPTSVTISGVVGNSSLIAYYARGSVPTSNWVKTSTDGVAWTTRMTFGITSFGPLNIANGIFFLGGQADILRSSTDGITWTTRVIYGMNPGTNVNGPVVAYGNNTYVAVSYTGQVNTSTDGITWVTRQTGASIVVPTASQIYYGNAGFMVGSSANAYATSTDGITWVTRTSASFATINNFTYGDNKYVIFTSASSSAKAKIFASTNFTTWTYISDFLANTSDDRNAVGYLNNMFVAALNDSSSTTESIAVSTDAITWVTKNAGTGTNNSLFGYGNSRYFAIAASGTSAYASTDISGPVTNAAVVNLIGSRPTAIF